MSFAPVSGSLGSWQLQAVVQSQMILRYCCCRSAAAVLLLPSRRCYPAAAMVLPYCHQAILLLPACQFAVHQNLACLHASQSSFPALTAGWPKRSPRAFRLSTAGGCTSHAAPCCLQWVEWALPTRIPGVSLQHTPAQHLHRFITHKISEFQESVARRAAARAADPRLVHARAGLCSRQPCTFRQLGARTRCMASSPAQSQDLPNQGCWLPVPHLHSCVPLFNTSAWSSRPLDYST